MSTTVQSGGLVAVYGATQGPSGAQGPAGPTGPAGPSASGDGFVHVTGSSTDGSARAVQLATADVSGTLPVANGGTGLTSPGTVGKVLTSTGAGIAPKFGAGPVLNILDYGAIPNDSSSAARAFNTSAIAAVQAALAIYYGGSPTHYVGRVFCPRGDYYFAADMRSGFTDTAIHLVFPVILEGEGTEWRDGTRFLIPQGLKGIYCWYPGQTSPVGTSSDTTASAIRRISIAAEGSPSVAPITAHGITITAGYCAVEHVQVSNFGGDGVHITSAGGTNADFWSLSHVYIGNCQNGLYVGGGDDAQVGHALKVDVVECYGWGIFDESPLGSTYDTCSATANALGPFHSYSAVPSNFIGCYSESGGSPSQMLAGTWVIGGDPGAGYTSDTLASGGMNCKYMFPSITISQGSMSSATITGSGTDPRLGVAPQITFSGQCLTWIVSLRIQITTTGYPGGLDAFGNSAASVVLEYSVDGGSTWTTSTPSTTRLVVIGSTGLTAHLVPYQYTIGNLYAWTVTGGTQTFTDIGLRSSSFPGALAWGQTTPGYTCPQGSSDDPLSHVLAYNPTSGCWECSANMTYYGYAATTPGFEIAGGRGLPKAGAFITSVLWGRSNAGAQLNRLSWAPSGYSPGDTSWIGRTPGPMSFNVGDVLLNDGSSSAYPLGWRVMSTGGFVDNAQGSPHWEAGKVCYIGDTVIPSTPNGRLYRMAGYTGPNSAGNGLTGAIEPSWPSAGYGNTVVDVNASLPICSITWEDVGVAAAVGTLPTSGAIFEAFGAESETAYSLACGAGGAITTTLAQSSHKVVVLTGSPGSAFSVELDSGPAGSWSRTVQNSTGQTATIKGSSGDSGVSVAAGEVVQVMNDGSACHRVTGTLAGDVIGSPTASVVSQARSGSVTFSATGMIGLATGDTTPGLSQASTSSASPAPLVIAPQASVNGNGNGGSLHINLPAATGTGTVCGSVTISDGANPIYYMGAGPPIVGVSWTGLWMGTSAAAPATADATIFVTPSYTMFMAPSFGLVYLGAGGLTSMSADSHNVQICYLGGAPVVGGGVGCLGISDANTAPTSNPSGGGVLYSAAGAGKWRGSSGTVTTIGPAELDGFRETTGNGHCPSCGTDFAHEWSNDTMGSLTICMLCLAAELGDRPWIVRRGPKT